MHVTPSAAGIALVLALGAAAYAQSAGAPPDPYAAGKHVFQKANCMGCHKWDGSGGGGYGGAALSLRATTLDPEQIALTVRCGRPGTGMPYHLRGAYDDPGKPCYGVGRAELDRQMPPEPTVYLRDEDVQAVVAYVVHDVKGKGATTYEDCVAFWGAASRVCGVYKSADTVTARPGG